MEDVLKLVSENWKAVSIVAAMVGYFGWDKAKAALVSVGKKAKSVVVPKQVINHADVEAEDVAAIAHLRNRAVEANDEVLLGEIKSVAAKFFDMHSSVVSKSDSTSI